MVSDGGKVRDRLGPVREQIFKSRFDSRVIRVELLKILFGNEQESDEYTMKFITNKGSLLERIDTLRRPIVDRPPPAGGVKKTLLAETTPITRGDIPRLENFRGPVATPTPRPGPAGNNQFS